MLQIRLNKGSSSDSGIGAKSLPMETVTVTCPDHLVLADLPVAKGLGSATALSRVKIVGRRSRRQLGERVHFCVRCDFPIAIYGRLSPCEHVFCLDCARSDSICYLCDERIQKIQSIKLMEGIFICAAPHCLKSFLKKSDFESHIYRNHGDLFQPKARKEEVLESDTCGAKQFTSADSSLRVAPRPGLQPSSSSQLNDRDDKARRQLPREQPPLQPPMPTKSPPYYGQGSTPSEPQHDSRPPGFEGVVPQNRPQQQNFDTQGGIQQKIHPDPRREYPQMYSHTPPNIPMPVNSNPPPFGFPTFPSEGLPHFYSVPMPYEMPRPELSTEGGAEQLLGYQPGPSGTVGYSEGYPRPWFGSAPNIPFEAMQGGQSTTDGSVASSDHQGRSGFYQGLPPVSNKVMEQSQAANAIDCEGILASQPMPPPPPPPGPPPPHLLQQKQDNYFFSDTGHDGKNYGP